MTAPAGTDSAHQSPCSRCGTVLLISLSATRLEQRPWRFVWSCPACGETSVRAVPRHLAPSLVEWYDRAGGTIVSRREVRELERLDLDLFRELIVEEILLEA